MIPKNTKGTKIDLIRKIELLLEVAGTQTPWDEVEDELERLSLRCITALEYRIRQARSDSYSEGQAQ